MSMTIAALGRVALSVSLVTAGCSLIGVRGPMSNAGPGALDDECTTNYSLPILDGLATVALASAAGAVFATAKPHQPDSIDVGTLPAVPLSVFAFGFTASAIVGLGRIGGCRSARRQFLATHPAARLMLGD